jgi:murein DD-endopeptidase
MNDAPELAAGDAERAEILRQCAHRGLVYSDQRFLGSGTFRRTAMWSLVGLALVLKPASVRAQNRVPIVQSLELAVLQSPVIVPVEGVRQLVYELHLTNLRSTDVALTRIEVRDGERSTVLGDFHDGELQAALGRPGIAKRPADNRVIGAGMRAVFYAWLPLGNAVAPASLTHRIELEMIQATGHEPAVTQGSRTSVRRDPPLVLGAPVQDGRWVAIYGPEVDRGHRRVIYTIDGRSRIPGRFAVDWKKIGDDNMFVSGDSTTLANWHGYDAKVLAVADATIVEVKDDVPEDTPISSNSRPIALENASGNYIVLSLGGGRYAFYEHLKPGSIPGKKGQRVRRGDVIGRLGNTGSSSAGPHLHFHVSDANASVGAEGLPFVFESFDLLGRFEFPGRTPAGGDQPAVLPLGSGVETRRRRELPPANAVVRF